MLKDRQDAWTDEDDLLLAETVLRHVREGSTQLNAFEEVGDDLNRTSAACGFRWNAVVRHRYEKALQLAKKFRKEKMRALGGDRARKKLLYTPPTPNLGVLETSEFTDYIDATPEVYEEETVISPMPTFTDSEVTYTESVNSNSSIDKQEMTMETKSYSQAQSKEFTLKDVIAFLQNYKGNDQYIQAIQLENNRLRQENSMLRMRNDELNGKLSSKEQESNTIQEDYETIMKIMNRARKMVLFDEDDRGASFKMDRNGNLERLAE